MSVTITGGAATATPRAPLSPIGTRRESGSVVFADDTRERRRRAGQVGALPANIVASLEDGPKERALLLH
jgi:hypothetical protein